MQTQHVVSSVWVEVLDPASGRKVDVTVGLHTFGSIDPEVLQGDEDLTLRVTSRVITALEAAGFDLSDREDRWTAHVTR